VRTARRKSAAGRPCLISELSSWREENDVNVTGLLEGKVAVVTGAGQVPGAGVGNGRAAALLYAKAGASVVAANRSIGSAEETARLIEEGGGEAIAMQVDVAEEDDIAEMADATLQRWGRIDILHNNVGVGAPGGDSSVTDIEASALQHLLAINLAGTVLACKHVLPTMRSQQSGVITNISSTAALTDYPYVAYKAAKAGVITLTQHLAARNAEFGIRANVLIPGLMDTPHAVERKITASITREQVLNERRCRTPLLGRSGNAWDVANAAVFLASEAAGFITGASLVIDGGQSLRIG
jgi:NAD(P)-dependent dehydrogenase (short-subunit alcohol dehydrogenase family)